jgi:hypothetical protein
MAVVGPGNNSQNADKATEEILQLIKEKYGVRTTNLIDQKDFQVEMNQAVAQLRETMRTIFRLDSWDSW